MNDRDEAGSVTRILEALKQNALLEPLSRDEVETQSWQDHDLANLVENRFGVMLDVNGFGDEERRTWVERATEGPDGLGFPHSRFQQPFWIRREGKRVGTIAVASSVLGAATLRVSSLYVVPAARRRGLGRRALDVTYEAAVGAGVSGIGFSTDWSWQQTVGFYLRVGAWVRSWKRSLELVRREDLPAWRVEVTGSVARFVVGEGDNARALITARRVGARLEWSESGVRDAELPFEAPGTFALALAVLGFPLVTSDDEWSRQLEMGFSDCGELEGLAFKIRQFEAWDRKHGWLTPAPRIPGLDYPDWDALRSERVTRS